MLPPDEIIELCRAARLSVFVAPHVKLKQRGRYLLGLCPFHEEQTPSFMVDDELGTYHCFGCSVTGNVLGFLMEAEKLTSQEAAQKIQNELEAVGE